MIDFILTIVSMIGLFVITKEVYSDMQERSFMAVFGLGILVVGAFLYVITN